MVRNLINVLTSSTGRIVRTSYKYFISAFNLSREEKVTKVIISRGICHFFSSIHVFQISIAHQNQTVWEILNLHNTLFERLKSYSVEFQTCRQPSACHEKLSMYLENRRSRIEVKSLIFSVETFKLFNVLEKYLYQNDIIALLSSTGSLKLEAFPQKIVVLSDTVMNIFG